MALRVKTQHKRTQDFRKHRTFHKTRRLTKDNILENTSLVFLMKCFLKCCFLKYVFWNVFSDVVISEIFLKCRCVFWTAAFRPSGPAYYCVTNNFHNKKDVKIISVHKNSNVKCGHLVQENNVTPVGLLLSWFRLHSWTMNCDYSQHPPAGRQQHLCTFQETQPAEDSKYTREEET